jgi:hypothetical protein
MNIHDEIQLVHKPELREVVRKVVEDFVESYRDLIPMIGMTWNSNLNSWGDK